MSNYNIDTISDGSNSYVLAPQFNNLQDSSIISMGHISSFEGTISSPEDAMFAILEICTQEYSGNSNKLFIGSFLYSAIYHFEVFVYNTSDTVDYTYNSNTRTVPNYSNGYYYTGYGSGIQKWVGTSGGTFSANTTSIYTKNIFAKGHSSAIGTIKSASGTSYTIPSTATSSSTSVATASVSLEEGVWQLNGSILFTNNATGRRYATIYTGTGGNNYSQEQVDAVNGASTVLNLAYNVSVSSTTTYAIYAAQTSGADLTARAYLTAVRIL